MTHFYDLKELSSSGGNTVQLTTATLLSLAISFGHLSPFSSPASLSCLHSCPFSRLFLLAARKLTAYSQATITYRTSKGEKQLQLVSSDVPQIVAHLRSYYQYITPDFADHVLMRYSGDRCVSPSLS